MITAGKLVDNVKLIYTGGKPSDDNNLHRDQILFMFSYVTAHLIEEKRKEAVKVGENIEFEVDPILLQEYKNLVITDGRVTLPVTPFSLPQDMGLYKVLLGDGECFEAIPQYSHTQAYLENHLWFKQAFYVREGSILKFKHTKGLKKVTLIISGISDELKDTDIFPIPPELIAKATDLVVNILKVQVTFPADYTNDTNIATQ